MHIMRLIFRNMLLSLILGPCFVYIQAQASDKTDTNATSTLLNIETVEANVSSVSVPHDIKSTSALTHEYSVTEPAKKLETEFHTESLQVYQMSTNLKESTAKTTVQLSTGTEPMTTVSESTTAPEEYTTKALETSTTTVTESITSDSLSNTNLQETTVVLTTTDLTTSVHQQHEIATVAMTTGSTEAPDPTTITSQQPADWTESPSIRSSAVDTTFLDATTITSTTAVISTSQSINRAPELHHSTSGYDSVSTHFTPSITGGNIRQSISSTQTNWLLIVIVCVVVVCALCMGLLLIALQRRKNASGKFGPGYMNGQSKRSKKKKGAENDAWAGPVHLEAAENVDCDGEVHQAQMSDDANIDGEDMVLSTFTAPEAGETPDGGVGGEGTKEAKKWEEQEPLLYIDEDVKEDNMGKTVAGNEKQKVKENQEKLAHEENVLNGGEAFCLTTAV